MKRFAMMTAALALSMMVAGQTLAQQRRGPPAERPEAQRMQVGPFAGVMMALHGLESVQELVRAAALSEEQQQEHRAAMRGVMEQVRAGKIERDQARERMAGVLADIQTAEQREAAAALESKVEEVVAKIKEVLTAAEVEALEEALARPPRGVREGAPGRERGERPAGAGRERAWRPQNG